MSPEEQAVLRRLLTEERVLSLAVVVEGAPVVGLLPFAAYPDLSSALIHASTLARHTAGLREHAAFSLLIHLPDQPEIDPLQIARVTLQGEVHLLAKGGSEYAAGREIYTRKFPSSLQTFDLGDFNLYRLRFNDGRFVAGFGRAYNVTRDSLRRLTEA